MESGKAIRLGALLCRFKRRESLRGILDEVHVEVRDHAKGERARQLLYRGTQRSRSAKSSPSNNEGL